MQSITLTLATGRLVQLSPRAIESFASRIAAPDANGCARWTGRVDRDGYGLYPCHDAITSGKVMLSAHRVAFRLAAGRSAEPGMDVDHRCFDRLCMAHLAELPAAKNRGRHNKRDDIDVVCVHGHPRLGNTRIDPRTGYRTCIPCAAAAGLRHRARQQAV